MFKELNDAQKELRAISRKVFQNGKQLNHCEEIVNQAKLDCGWYETAALQTELENKKKSAQQRFDAIAFNLIGSAILNAMKDLSWKHNKGVLDIAKEYDIYYQDSGFDFDEFYTECLCGVEKLDVTRKVTCYEAQKNKQEFAIYEHYAVSFTPVVFAIPTVLLEYAESFIDKFNTDVDKLKSKVEAKDSKDKAEYEQYLKLKAKYESHKDVELVPRVPEEKK